MSTDRHDRTAPADRFTERLGSYDARLQDLERSHTHPAGSGLAGEIIMWPGDHPPVGFALCDGAALLAADYPDLFAVIGRSFGGTDPYFRLPDLRGRFPLAAGGGVGLSLRDVSDIGGAERSALSANEMPSHSHAVAGNSGTTNIQHSHSFTAPTWSGGGWSHNHTMAATGAAGVHNHGNPDVSTTPQHTHGNPATNAAGAHTHSHTGYTTSTSGTAGGNILTVSGGANTGSAGSHTHTVPSTSGGGLHGHSQGATHNSVSHTHDLPSTQITNGGDHTHNLPGTAPEGGAHYHGIAFQSGATGAGAAHDRMPPFMAVNFMIRLVAIPADLPRLNQPKEPA